MNGGSGGGNDDRGGDGKGEGLFRLFLAEARDHLDAIEECLLRLEKRADDGAAFQDCFRALHTLKGCAAFFQVTGIERMGHACEQVLDALRAGALRVEPGILALLLDGNGVMSRLLVRLARLERLDEFAISEAGLLGADDLALCARIMDAAAPAGAAGPAAPPADAVPAVPTSLEADFLAEAQDLIDAVEQVLLRPGELDAEDMREACRGLHTLKGIASYLGRTAVADRAHRAEELFLDQGGGMPRRTLGADDRRAALAGVQELHGLLHPGPSAVADAAPAFAMFSAAPAAAAPAAAAEPAEDDGRGTPLPTGTAEAEAAPAPAAGDPYTRVATARLEDLVNLVGELAITQAMLARTIEDRRLGDLRLPVQRQSRTLRQLQVLVLGLRMVPLRTVFRKMARAVHDAAQRCGKPAALRTAGEETEIDRSLAEALADPLLHLVRNAVDHGLEDAAARAAAGKPAGGTITLAAAQVGEQVEISVGDDGGGVDLARVRATAAQRGLLAPGVEPDEAALLDLLFRPGFTTRERVSDLSGRGVGLDVVRTRIAQLKGTVEVRSAAGRGTTMVIRVPLTTAILDAMVACSGTERYLVPVSAVLATVQVDPGTLRTILARGMVHEFRGALLPVVPLAALLGDDAPAPAERMLLLVLERVGGRLALLVDAIAGLAQVVVKPLPARFGHHQGLSGSAIMADGRVALIIDPQRLLVAEAVP